MFQSLNLPDILNQFLNHSTNILLLHLCTAYTFNDFYYLLIHRNSKTSMLNTSEIQKWDLSKRSCSDIHYMQIILK
jgi:hypothetical protein